MLDEFLRTVGAWIDANAWLSVLAWRIAGIAAAIGLGLLDMLRALVAWIDAHPGIAAWVQAAATVAVLVVVVRLRRENRERATQLALGAAERARRGAEAAGRRREMRCRRVVAALRAEIGAALESAATRHESVNKLDREIKNSIALGKIVDLAPLRFTSLGITEGVAFRALGADIGLLPPLLIGGAVKFYNHVAEQNRALATAKTVQQQIWLLQESIPRIRMDGEVLAAELDRFERSGFDENADLRLPEDEIAAFAKKAGYAPEKSAAARGVSI